MKMFYNYFASGKHYYVINILVQYSTNNTCSHIIKRDNDDIKIKDLNKMKITCIHFVKVSDKGWFLYCM